MTQKIAKTIAAVTIAAVIVLMTYISLVSCIFADNSYTIVSGGSVDAYLPYFVSCRADAKSVSISGRLKDSAVQNTDKTENMRLMIFGIIPVKDVSVNVSSEQRVAVSGECIGVKMYARGLVVTAVDGFEGADGTQVVSPASKAGMRVGDIVQTINGADISSVSHFIDQVDMSDGVCVLGFERDGRMQTANVYPMSASDGHRRLGMWVRDSVAGIGTMTFFDKDSGSFASLGHGISDSTADVLIPIKSGNVYKASILGINKGKSGQPGEIIGALDESQCVGKCTQNTNIGVYGLLNNSAAINIQEFDVMPASQIQKGDASVICSIDDSGPKEYAAKIRNINKMRLSGSKCMVIEITDRRLISKTGGIIQGMSGSPIVQNGKIVGAVTHVFVNNPTKGYAIFAENMLSEAAKIR